ncbi:MAG: acyltransferase [Candidatus Accumulibacter sp.]|uniref:Acyltransferase n=1 Tax=Candidatus Accumulibacter proximus TaxID=2954385 RepID=A0A935UGZ2_9PROT|nr:acyltransferase [Candidatus Accumulibacter proximus]
MQPPSSPRLTENNFDLLRLLFAGTVCLVHAYELSGFSDLAVISQVLSSGMAVKGFFVLSGFLIFMSFERSTSLSSYAMKRIRRIYPAYFTVVMLCAVGMVAVSSLSAAEYFSGIWVRYVLANLTFMNFFQHALPGVFENNRLTAVNGALWSIKIEVMFYLVVPMFVFLFRKFGYLWLLVLTYCASVLYAEIMTNMAERSGSQLYAELGRQLPGQLSYFMSGAFLYYFLPLFERRLKYFLAFSVAVFVTNRYFPLPMFVPFALAIAVIFFSLFLYVGNLGKYGDFSYGAYILHCPLIQLLIHFGWFSDSPWLFLASATVITAAGAIAMWHLVEKRFLFRSSHYIAATAEAGG